MNYPRHDFDENNLFGRDEALRRTQDRDEARKLAAQREAMFAAQEAAVAQRVREWTGETTRRAIAAEYALAGVAPPSVNGSGEPTCSLALLLRLGWRVETDERGANVLVAPAR